MRCRYKWFVASGKWEPCHGQYRLLLLVCGRAVSNQRQPNPFELLNARRIYDQVRYVPEA